MRTEFHAKRVACEERLRLCLSPGREAVTTRPLAAAYKCTPESDQMARWIGEGGGDRWMGVEGVGGPHELYDTTHRSHTSLHAASRPQPHSARFLRARDFCPTPDQLAENSLSCLPTNFLIDRFPHFEKSVSLTQTFILKIPFENNVFC